ncbi:uncharacterized protein LOC127259031 [Andrographis paniculata]|uniref:uncharacterized protein LOC127259031 n=1 Tax=Andrographis paniculata TaxID=175694 RepID=UPI0021E72BF7|nr:uncharacterized protein LOC127259031 [Andrographis paniculata]
MAKPNAQKHEPSPSPWGTLEDLLLAFAVNRHGNAAWDSIASELRKRSSQPPLLLTPTNCRLKYLDLKRRFASPNHDSNDGEGDDDDKSDAAPLLEKLRKLRVAELRREVQRYDLNIESLESKVKKLEEERERSLKEESESDPEKKIAENTCIEAESEPATATAGEPVTGEESEKDQLSVNESNSTDLGAEKLKSGEKEPEPARMGEDGDAQNRTGQVSEEPTELKSEPDLKLIPEDSCNGSSNSIEKSDRKPKGKPENYSTGLVEPDAASDSGGEEATKENSDVQSSASRSRKKEKNVKMRRERTNGDEREREDQSRAVKDLTAESQPLADFLQCIRAQKFGSLFERRLRSQETSKYQKLVLQHIDLTTIETRLKEGWYSGSSSKFFRDLLLLANNAVIFFGKKSSEAKAATEMRQFISKELSEKQEDGSNSPSRKQVSLKSLSLSKNEEQQPPPQPVPLKPRISNPLIVCRKRSSLAAKAAAAAAAAGSGTSASKKKEEKDTKQHSPQPSDSSSDEPKITKKRTRDRFSSVPARTKKNGKNQSNHSNRTSAAASDSQQQGKGGSSSSSPKSDNNKKNQSSTLESKKRGAANFLNRMKQQGSDNGALVDALKNRPLTSERATTSKGEGSTEQQRKKKDNGKSGEKKEAASTAAATKTRQPAKEKEKEKEKEKSSPGKRNVGRPPKRGAAAAPPVVLGKRGREKTQDTETKTPTPKQAKKRTRKQ